MSLYQNNNNDNNNKNDNNKNNDNDGIWIGIDFGTSNCSVAVWDTTRGRPKSLRLPNISIPNVNNNKIGRLVPSLVDSQNNVGAKAIPPNIISSVKRLIGYHNNNIHHHHGDDNKEEYNQFLESLPYKVIFPSSEEKSEEGKELLLKIQFPNGQITTPDEIITILLKEIRISSEIYLNSREAKRKNMILPGGGSVSSGEENKHKNKIRNVVIGVPANFSKLASERIINATKNAGYTGIIKTCLESTAAAMAYGLTLQNKENQNNNNTIMVIDMGGGTTDITIATTTTSKNNDDDDNNDNASYKVLVTHGNSQLGGDDIDYSIMDYCYKQQQKQKHKSNNNKNNVDQHHHNQNNNELRLECRKAKERLCDIENPCDATQIEYVVDDDDVKKESSSSKKITTTTTTITLTKQQFELLLEPWLQRAKVLIQQSLDKLSKSKSSSYDVNEVILVGGTTKIPSIRKLIQSFFPSIELCTSLNPMLSVGQGLSIMAAILSKKVPIYQIKSALMLDCIPHSIGVLLSHNNNNNFVEIIPRNTPLPARGSATFTLANPNQPGVTIKAVEEIINNSNNTTGGDNNKYFYEPMSSEDFTFLLKRIQQQPPKSSTTSTTTRTIEVGMMVDMQGQFIVSIFDENDPEQVRKRNRLINNNNNKEEEKKNGGQNNNETTYGELEYIVDLIRDESGMTNTEQFLLTATLIGVFVLYIAVKIAFSEPGRDGSTIL